MLPSAPIVITNSRRRQSVKPETEGLMTIVAAIDPSGPRAVTSTVCLVLMPCCAVKVVDTSSVSVDKVLSCSLLDLQVTFLAAGLWKGIDCEPFAAAN